MHLALLESMFVQFRQKLLFNAVAKYGKPKKYSISAVKEIKDENQNTVEPEYPPIIERSRNAKKKKKWQAWYDQIQSLKTVEEKLFKFNMPRYYGWKSVLLDEYYIPYNSLAHAQHITRTHIMKEPGLPSYYNGVISNEQLDNILQSVKSNIEDNIVFEHCVRRREHEFKKDILFKDVEDVQRKWNIEDVTVKAVIQNINRTMLIHLSSKYPHLLQAGVDFEPRLEASWFAGGIDPPNFMRKFRKSVKFLKNSADDPVNLPFQYSGHPVIHLRHKHLLKEVISASECENPALDVPIFKFPPQVLTYEFGRRHLTNIPGFWPGDENEFGLLSYHNCTHLQRRKKEFNDTFAALKVQAVLASYSWLLSQACYQGFSTFNDITYPLITQTVITDGQWWSFCVYQLNTLLLHSEHVTENPKRNVCWITEPMKLFDTIEKEKVCGLNEEVLKNLIKFYVNTPEERLGVDLKPYLEKSEKVIADIEDDERRNWLEQHYKHLVCNRPRHKRIPEIYNWQRLYLIHHKTRPMDKKRDWWQFGKNIFKRRLDDHLPPYIPRCLRENPKKRKLGRWAKQFYP